MIQSKFKKYKWVLLSLAGIGSFSGEPSINAKDPVIAEAQIENEVDVIESAKVLEGYNLDSLMSNITQNCPRSGEPDSLMDAIVESINKIYNDNELQNELVTRAATRLRDKACAGTSNQTTVGGASND